MDTPQYNLNQSSRHKLLWTSYVDGFLYLLPPAQTTFIPSSSSLTSIRMGLRPPWQAWTCLTRTALRSQTTIPAPRFGITSNHRIAYAGVASLGLRSLSTTRPLHTPGRGRQTETPDKPSGPIDPDQASKALTEKQQAKADWRIIIQLARNVWPKNSPGIKVRVAGALGLLIAGKLLNVQVPFFFKQIVDSLNVPITESTTVWVLAGASIAGCEQQRSA